jgi:hypothetical protein
MANAGDYIIRPFTYDQFSHLSYLYENAFREKVATGFLEKKYNTEPFGAGVIGFLAYTRSGEPAAYYGIFPLTMMYNGKRVLAAQSGDTMTHSHHRGRGLFVKLAALTYEKAAEEGIAFVYGFPNRQNSYGGLMKLNWTHNGDLKKYSIFVPALPLAGAATKFPAMQGIYDSYSMKILRKYITGTYFQNSLAGENIIYTERDEKFYIYKQYCKKFILDVNGIGVYVKLGSSLQVGDMEKVDMQTFFRVLDKLKRLAFAVGAHCITFQFSPGVWMDNYLSIRYEPREGMPVCYLDFGSGLDLSNLKFTLADFDTF